MTTVAALEARVAELEHTLADISQWREGQDKTWRTWREYHGTEPRPAPEPALATVTPLRRDGVA